MEEFKQKPELMPAHVLAYVGDAIFELFIRTHLVKCGFTKVNNLHKEAIRYVNASTQAKILRSIEKTLTETEMGIVRRGRNSKSGRVPKNADMIDYRYATAFESLVGFLYLKGEEKRLNELFINALDIVENPKEEGSTGNDEG